MNLDKNINDIVDIFNSFKENDDFYHELMKEAYSVGHEEEARKITRARDEFKNGYKISQNTVDLIKANVDKYIKIITTLKEKSKQNEFITSNDTYTMNLNPNELQNENEITSTNNNSNEINNENASNSNEEEKEDKDKQTSFNDNSSAEVLNDNNELDDSNYVYSSTVAKNNLERELATINSQINVIRNRINNSEKMPSKKEYQQLFQLESYKDKIEQRLKSINLEESYGNNERIAVRDNKLKDINNKIKENKEKLQSNKPKFIKVAINRRLTRLKEKQGRIKDRQRTVVNKDLLNYYKQSFKISKSASRDNAINQYYQDKKDLLQEKKEAILDNVDIYNNSIITNMKNKFYKLKSLPTSARISYIEGLQQKEGKLNGFKHLNKDISSKLYPKIENVKNNTKQMIEQLKQISGYLKNTAQTQQYNTGMEEIISNLVPEQPALEEKSSMRR